MTRFWLCFDGKGNDLGYVVRSEGDPKVFVLGPCQMELPSTKTGKATQWADFGDNIKSKILGVLLSKCL